MSRIAMTFASVAVGLATTCGSASAVTVHPTDGTAPFTASSTGTTVFEHSFGSVNCGRNCDWRATSATYNGTTTSPPDGIFITHPVFSGATALVAGITYPASVSVGAAGWRFTLTNAVSPFTASIAMLGPTKITAAGLSGTLTMPAQTGTGAVAINSGSNLGVMATVLNLAWETTPGSDYEALAGSSGTDGEFSTGGFVIFAGVNIS
jgi:hypothetical protein